MPNSLRPTDRRILRTRAMLRDALTALILERGYDPVTIQDITDRADLARATFYLHYRDKEDLLASSLEALYDDLVSRTLLNRDSFLAGSAPPGLIAFQHAAENADLYRVILRGQGVGVIIMRIREHLAGQIEAQFRRVIPKNTGPVPPEVVANYVTGALLGLISWWLERDLPHTPEDMAEMFQQTTRNGVLHSLGVEVLP